MARSLTPTDRYRMARRAGFSATDAVIATAISIAENRPGDPELASPPNKNGSVDLGLMQINQGWWGTFGGRSALEDPLTNMRAALRIQQNRGSWADWSTYNDGSYRSYLPIAQSAAAEVEAGGAPPVEDTKPTDAPALVVGVPTSTLARTVGDQLGAIAQGGQQLAQSTANGQLVGAVQNTARGVGGLVAGFGDFFALIARVIGDLSDSRLWWKILLVLLGAAAVLVGLVLYVRPPMVKAMTGG